MGVSGASTWAWGLQLDYPLHSLTQCMLDGGGYKHHVEKLKNLIQVF